MPDCLFCKIAAGEIPSSVVYQDDDVFAFRDINPQAPFHVLIVPKHHVESIQTMTATDVDAIGRCLLAARTIGERKGFGDRGYRVSINCGPEGGQVVPHVHFHFLAGRRGVA